MNRCLVNLGIKDTRLIKQTEVALRTELDLQVDENAKLGNGAYGHVYISRRTRKPNEQVACKLFETSDSGQWKSFACEANAYRLIQSNNEGHANILHFECAFQIMRQNDSNGIPEAKFIKIADKLNEWMPPVESILYGLVVEKVDIDFHDWLLKHQVRAFGHEQISLELFRQIGSALQFIHSKHYLCHHDLKMDNFGIVTSANGSFPTIKLLDFGLAYVYDKYTFQQAETKCTKTFSLEQDIELNNKNEDEFQFCCPFLMESFTFGRILVDVIRQVCGDSDKLMDNVQNKLFKKLAIGLANSELTINSAIEITKSEGL